MSVAPSRALRVFSVRVRVHGVYKIEDALLAVYTAIVSQTK